MQVENMSTIIYLIWFFIQFWLTGCISFDNSYPRVLQVINGMGATFEWKFMKGNSENLNKTMFFYKEENGQNEVTIAVKDTGKELLYNPNLQKFSQEIKIETDGMSYARLTLNPVKLDLDGWTFLCKIENEFRDMAQASTRLEVVYAPVFNSKAENIYESKGVQKSLLCSVAAKPDASVMWYRGGKLLTNRTMSSTFEFQQLRLEDAGNYTCIASNVAGKINYTVEVLVKYKPIINKKLTTTRVGTYVGNGNPTRLRCVADAYPTPSYRWNSPLGYEVSSESVYVFHLPTLEQIGSYTCVAKNDAGSVTQNVEVVLIGKPAQVVASIVRVSARSIDFKLIPPVDLGNGEMKKLFIRYHTGDTVDETDIPPKVTEYTLNYLKPYTQYKLDILVANAFFESDGQNFVRNTSSAAPSPPTNVIIEVTSPYSMTVTWSKPFEPNGIITRYSVKFFEFGTSTFDNVTLIPMGLSNRKEFTKLKPYTQYHVYVSASTIAGDGDWSKMQADFTEATAPSQPRDVKITIQHAQKITITWLPPAKITGLITKYQFKFRYTMKETSQTFEKLFYRLPDRKTGRKFDFDNMLPYTMYEISLREASGKGEKWGNFSELKTIIMPEGVPEPPTDFEVAHIGFDDTTLRWRRPKKVNGLLKKFSIVYTNNSGLYTEELQKQLHNKTFYHHLLHLKPNSKYSVTVMAHSALYKSLPTSSLELTTNNKPEPYVHNESNNGDGSNTGAILGGVFSALVLLAIVVIIYVYISRKKRMKSANSDNSNAGFMKLANRETSPVMEVDVPKHCPTGNGFISCDYSCSMQCTFTPLRPILVSALKDYVAKCHANKDKGFIDEFKAIKPEGDFAFEVSTRPENKCKNRYANILAYDHSRVVLNTVENLDGSDYVNANYIDGYTRKAKFIATQGPVLAAFSDFWRMVWEQNSETIVMVTNLVERSRIKCQKYWPTLSEKMQRYSNIRVDIIDEMELADYIIRRFKIQMVKSSDQPPREVVQYQFLSWPDHGVPQFATPLLQFIKRVRSASDDNVGPIVLHCSAGVGRTGTYILIDSMLDQIELEKAIDVFGSVTHIRSQRNFMVQTEAQYVFIYNALLEAVSCGNTEINASDLPAKLKHLDSLNPGTARTYMQEEFERLCLNIDDSNQYESAVLPYNCEKNRFPEVLPYEPSRVKLWPYPNVEGSDYINASFVDGYQQREAYILTQAPMEKTIQDFWRMIWEYEVFSVVMISSSVERDMHHCYPYWPMNNEPTLFGLLRVQISTEEEKSGFIRREFRVTNSKNGESRTISHFMYFDWRVEGAPDYALVLEMVGILQKTQHKTGNSSIVIHCSDGSGRSGSLAALMYCLERLKLEGIVDVFQTVRSMRTQRKALVQSLEQYQFIYAAVRNFLDCFSDYANFK